MRLAFTDSLIVTNHFDPEMAMLADRHYSRRTVGARQFLYSGRKIVIRDAAGDVLFGWLFPEEDITFRSIRRTASSPNSSTSIWGCAARSGSEAVRKFQEKVSVQ